MTDTIDLEISLNRTVTADRYAARARLKLSGRDRVADDGNRDVTLDVKRLAGLRDADAYGSALTDMLFGAREEETPVKAAFLRARAKVADNPVVPMRLRLRFEQEANELHALRWETLCDPDTRRRLATDTQVLFSRILQPGQSGEAPPAPPPRSALKALVVIATPSDIGESYGMDGQPLQRIDAAAARAAIAERVAGIGITWLCAGGDGKPTLEELIARLRDGCDLLYLVCHGALEDRGPGQPPAAKIWLEDVAGGTATVYADDQTGRTGQKTPGLAAQLAGLTRKPRLVVLSACQGGGRSHDAGALAAFGPRLMAAGVPAVVAMQDDVAVGTADAFAARFFEVLLDPARGGVIDHAVAVARGRVADQADWWAPALFMYLESGRLWDEPAGRANSEGLIKPVPPSVPELRGRKAFLDSLSLLLRAKPLIGLYGLPGVGKTAAALGLANHEEVEALFPDGRAWLPLGPKPDIFAALGQLMTKFGVSLEGLTDEAARADRLAAKLDGKRYLLILDDVWACEDAQVFRDLCRPPAQMVITSRFDQVLDELQADSHEVPPLDLIPSVEMLQDAGQGSKEAITADPNGGAGLVAALNRLPLALHVAGRQLNRIARDTGKRDAVLRLQRELTERKRLLGLRAAGAHVGIQDPEPTLEAIVGLSYDYLPGEDERRAFRRLAVFGGQPLSFTPRAMQDVWGADEGFAERIRRTLVDARLLERAADGASSPAPSHVPTGQADPGADSAAEPRYSIHPILADYAAARLADDPNEEAAAHLAHARHYAVIVAEADAKITGGQDLAGLALLDVEIMQVRRAIAWSQGRDDAAEAAEALRDLVTGLRNYAVGVRGMYGEYGVWLVPALDVCLRLDDKEGEANVLQAQGDVLAFQKQNDEALTKYEAALLLFRAVGARLGEANVLQAQGDVLAFQDRREEALTKYEAALLLFRAVGDRLGEANVLQAQGDVLAFQKQNDEALTKYEAALLLFRAVGARLGEANVLKAQGDVLAFQKQNDEALTKYEAALLLFRAVGARLGEANVLQAQGDVLAFQKQNDEALTKYEAALLLFRAVGARLGEANVLQAQGDVLAFQDRREEALTKYEAALGLFRAVGARLGEANVLKAQGDVLAFQDRREEALTKYEAALLLFRAVGARLGEANVLQAQGDVLAFQKQNDEALTKYEAALGLFRAVGARLGEANVLKAQGDVLAFQDRREEALTKYEAALGLFRAVGARLGEANVLKAQGDVLAFQDRREEALTKYEAALLLFRAVGARLGEANVLQAQGDVLAFQKQNDEALTKYEAALGLFRAVGDRLGEANVLKAQGALALSTDQVEVGLADLEAARTLYAAIGDRVGLSNVGIALAQYAARVGDLAAAVEFLRPAADFCLAIGHPLGPQLVAQIAAWERALAADTGATE